MLGFCTLASLGAIISLFTTSVWVSLVSVLGAGRCVGLLQVIDPRPEFLQVLCVLEYISHPVGTQHSTTTCE